MTTPTVSEDVMKQFNVNTSSPSDATSATVLEVMPVQFSAEIGAFLVEMEKTKDRLKLFAELLRDHFLVQGKNNGLTVRDNFPGVSVEILDSEDGKTGTVLIGSVAVIFENASAEQALAAASTFALPEKSTFRFLKYGILTREKAAQRLKETDEARARARAYLAQKEKNRAAERGKKKESEERSGGGATLDLDDLV